ncbi:hypothetical protein [Leptolyngbya sp. NIES-2104]|uniref:hypothetical protein n=1 Tax=Leptolyngbya sp. NIES-2104 TaxID=1552121 RepID=UPI00073E1563|nr:hypothetical protein [Leptolyngbya sp. NIES-2104]
MTRRRSSSWLRRLKSWFVRRLYRLKRWLRKSGQQQKQPRTQTQIQQTTHGQHNQMIARMSGGIAIAHIDRLVQNFHAPPQETLTLEAFWANWSQETDPPFSSSLIIGGRERPRTQLIEWLRGQPAAQTLHGDTPEEAIAFLTAVIQSLDSAERAEALSRGIVVSGTASWQQLITATEPLILIAHLEQPEGIGHAIQNGHHVFVPLGQFGSNGNSLPRIVRDAAELALREMGLSRDRAINLATLARRSLSALRRKLAITQNIQQPAWARGNTACELLAPLLAGAWSEAKEGDRQALSQLSGMPYEQLQSILVHWSNEPDPPVRRVGEIWMIAAQEDAWRLIARYLTNDDLQRFETVVIEILSELDPAYELPPEQRYAASIYGKVHTHSGHLRESITGTLALMASLSPEISFTASRLGEEVARTVVWQLTERAKGNGRLWASIAHQLPLLAEAAPGIFSKAIDADLTIKTSALVELFQDKASDAAWMTSSPHTGLLWALETLAWHPEYLSSAALNLARLVRLDPGGRLANRPAQSLREIFICWSPHTTASLESRIRVLDTIRRREPDVAWSLLVKLLPKRHDSASPTHGTLWRDWVPDKRSRVSDQEYIAATNAVLDCLLSDAGTDSTRWCCLINAIATMTDEQQMSLLRHLELLEPQQFSPEARAELCDCLRHEAIRHRNFPDADWSIAPDRVEQLENIYARFEPVDLIDLHLWRFKRGVEIPRMLDTSWEKREAAILNLRVEAVQEILEGQGWDGVLRLSEQAQEPSFIGEVLAKFDLLPIDLHLFLKQNLSIDSWRSQMVRSFVAISAYKYKPQWIENCVETGRKSWTSEQCGEFLLYLPFNVAVMDQLDDSDEVVQRYFWCRTQVVCLLDPIQFERMLTQLLKFERPHFAVRAIEWTVEQSPEAVSPERIAEVLELAIQTPPDSTFDPSAFAYDSAELLNYLEKTDLPHDRLVQLEWLYLRVHEHYRRPNTLYAELSSSPALFIEAIQYIFRAENDLPTELSDNAKALANLAWEFLESWQQMPGVQADSSVDAEALRDWVMQARNLANQCNRGKVADLYIGHALAFSPIDPDGAWPHQSVRELIEELESSETVRQTTAGGEQERILVEKYQNYAKQVVDQYPRTATVLRGIAEGYTQDAAREDRQAELTQDFWR